MANRHHFETLDGIRGVAAISVVLLHLGHWLHVPALATNSGLAVDLFFCLSGYVLCRAYGDRLNCDMPASKFIQIRLVRLWPLMALGTIISFAFVISRILFKHQEWDWHALLLAPILGLISLPFFDTPQAIGGPQVFPLNGPQYTLFLELLVNLLWGAHRQFRQLWFAVLIAIVALFGVIHFGLGGDETSTFWRGVPRVLASYFLGVSLYLAKDRLPKRLPQRATFYICTTLMLAMFYLPMTLPFSLCIIWIALIAPVLVSSGAQTALPDLWRHSALLFGRLSYPIYALHYPLFSWINGIYQMKYGHQNAAVELPVCLLAIILGSYIALVVFDEPVRRAWTMGGNNPLLRPKSILGSRLIKSTIR